MKIKFTLTAIIAWVSLFTFGQITIPKNATFVTPKVTQQLKGLYQTKNLKTLNLLFPGERVTSQAPDLKSSAAKQKLDSIVSHKWDATNQWVKYTKEEHAYDDNGRWITGVYYSWNSDTNRWTEGIKDVHTYNANNKWASSINYNWNNNANQWVNNSKNEYTYNANGYCTQLLASEWKVSSSQWVNNSKDELTYNSNGYWTQDIVSEWDTIANQWVNGLKYECAYNVYNKITEIIVYYWNAETSQWTNFMLFEFIYYTADGKLKESNVHFWGEPIYSAEWYLVTKNEYTYDSNERLFTEIISEYNIDIIWGSELSNKSKYEYSYDANANRTQSFVSKWDIDTSSWSSYSKEVNSYDLAYNFTDLLLPSEYFVQTIPSSNLTPDIINKPLEDIEYLWNKTSTNWDNNTKDIYYYSDLNGSGINEVTTDNLIIYPNPVSEGFYLNLSEKNIKVSIYDFSGNLLFTKQLSGNEYINVSALPHGIYMIKVTTDKGIITKKFVKK